MKVLVTGADGFVGRNLVPVLERQGVEVLRGVRRIRFQDIPNQVELGDLPLLPLKFSEKLQGFSAIVHLAGFAHQPQKSAENQQRCYDINVNGTKRVIEIAAMAGIEKVIFLSSVKAHGRFPKGSSVCELDADAPNDAYGLSKLQAEKEGFEKSSKCGFQFLAIRPPLIYGPGVKANFLSMIKIAQAGFPLPFNNVKNLRSFCYIENLTDAIGQLMRDNRRESNTFYIADQTPISTKDMLITIARHLNSDIRLFSLPDFFTNSIANWPMFRNFSEKLLGDLVVSPNKLVSFLNWEAPHSTDEGVRRTVQWYLSTRNTSSNRRELFETKGI